MNTDTVQTIIGLFNAYTPIKVTKAEAPATVAPAPKVETPKVQNAVLDAVNKLTFNWSYFYNVDTDRNLGVSVSTLDYDVKVGYNNPVDAADGWMNIRLWPYLDLFYNFLTVIELYVVRVNLTWLFSLARTDFVNTTVKINIDTFDEVCTQSDLTQANFFLQVLPSIDINECAYSIYDQVATGSASLGCSWTTYVLSMPWFAGSLLPEGGTSSQPIAEESCMENEYLPYYFKTLLGLNGIINLEEQEE